MSMPPHNQEVVRFDWLFTPIAAILAPCKRARAWRGKPNLPVIFAGHDRKSVFYPPTAICDSLFGNKLVGA